MVATVSTRPPAKNRLGYIDSVRGVAALYVLLQHTLEYAGFINVRVFESYNWLVNFGQSGVVAFFIVSGFIIPVSLERSTSAWSFWKSRILRIYPLYIFVMVATMLIIVYYNHIPIVTPLKVVAAQLIFINSWIGIQDLVGNSWTLVIEMLWYIGIFVWWKANGALRARVLAILAVVFALIVAGASLHLEVRLPMGRLGMFLACVVGLVTLEYTRSRIKGHEFAAILLALIGTCMVLLYVGFHLQPADRSNSLPFSVVAWSWLLGGMTFFFFYALRDTAIANNPLLLYIGRISFSVYLVHSPLMRVLHDFVGGYALIAAEVSLTFLIAHFTYRYIEHPFILMGRSRMHRTSSQPA